MKKTAIKALAGVAGAAALAAAGAMGWAWRATDAAFERRYDAARDLGMAAAVRVASVDLGRRIVTVRNGCVDCHGADLGGKTMVDEPLLGTVRAPNLTPSRLRGWSDDQVATAIRYGVAPDGRPLAIMPSHEYQHLSRDDTAAIVAYLRSVPAVDRDPGGSTLGPGARLLYALGKLPTLVPAETIDQRAGFADKPIEAPTVQFGRYLASSACAGCHGAEFRGGRIPGGPPDWPAAPALRLGTDERWSEASFVDAMRSGRSAIDGHPLRSPMPVALVAQMSEVELGALWRYFATLR